MKSPLYFNRVLIDYSPSNNLLNYTRLHFPLLSFCFMLGSFSSAICYGSTQYGKFFYKLFMIFPKNKITTKLFPVQLISLKASSRDDGPQGGRRRRCSEETKTKQQQQPNNIWGRGKRASPIRTLEHFIKSVSFSDFVVLFYFILFHNTPSAHENTKFLRIAKQK